MKSPFVIDKDLLVVQAEGTDFFLSTPDQKTASTPTAEDEFKIHNDSSLQGINISMKVVIE